MIIPRHEAVVNPYAPRHIFEYVTWRGEPKSGAGRAKYLKRFQPPEPPTAHTYRHAVRHICEYVTYRAMVRTKIGFRAKGLAGRNPCGGASRTAEGIPCPSACRRPSAASSPPSRAAASLSSVAAGEGGGIAASLLVLTSPMWRSRLVHCLQTVDLVKNRLGDGWRERPHADVAAAGNRLGQAHDVRQVPPIRIAFVP